MNRDYTNKDLDMLDSILKIRESFKDIPCVELKRLKTEETVIIIIDVINGFINEGPLSDNRIAKIIKPISKILDNGEEYSKIFFVDEHTKKSKELEVYPEHCLKGSSESELVDELKPYAGRNASVITKNSTNGFNTPGFEFWLKGHKKTLKNVVIVGDCTDICIRQFAISLKTKYNEHNDTIRVIVPMNSVDTFDLDITNHNAELMNLMALYDMKSNGIEIVKEVV